MKERTTARHRAEGRHDRGIPNAFDRFLDIAPRVAVALRDGEPVVALESTLISHGLPYPRNLEIARDAEAAVRDAGAVPATVAIAGGRIVVGLDDAAVERLAREPDVRKVARHTLAAVLASGAVGATTVSATMIAAHAAEVGVFATGGIGGVHRGAFGAPDPSSRPSPGPAAGPTLDISTDLEELARTPVAVVCAGPKSILDVRLTLEYLETRGVPVVTIGQDDVPGFYARTSGLPSPASARDLDEAAAIVVTHRALGLGQGILVCVPVPEAEALPEDVARAAVGRAVEDATAANVEGWRLTPWLLARIAELTEGASVAANRALILNNARVAARLAVALGASSG